MSAVNPARKSARYRWFSFFGILVGLGMVGGSSLLIFESARTLRAMPNAPIPCRLEACAERAAGRGAWVRIEGGELACERAFGVDQDRSLYVPIVAANEEEGPALLAALDDRRCEPRMPLIGTLRVAAPRLVERMRDSAPQLGEGVAVLWTDDGPGNQEGLIAIMAVFALVGAACVVFYARRLKDEPPLKAR
jgi:hypothetical protein